MRTHDETAQTLLYRMIPQGPSSDTLTRSVPFSLGCYWNYCRGKIWREKRFLFIRRTASPDKPHGVILNHWLNTPVGSYLFFSSFNRGKLAPYTASCVSSPCAKLIYLIPVSSLVPNDTDRKGSTHTGLFLGSSL